MVTRAKGKEVMLSEAQKQEQYNRLKEEELRCLAMQQKLREQRQALEMMQAPAILREIAPANPRQHAPPWPRPMIIPVEENSECSDSKAEEQQHYRQQRGRHHHAPKAPLSEDLDEI